MANLSHCSKSWGNLSIVYLIFGKKISQFGHTGDAGCGGDLSSVLYLPTYLCV